MARLTQETMKKLYEIDILSFAEAMNETLEKQGKHYFTYRNGGERTASLCITPSKNMWTDFGGSGTGFDVISFYAYRQYQTPKPRGEVFLECVKAVASIAGIPLVYEDGRTVEPDSKFKVKSFERNKYEDEDTPKASDDRINHVYHAWMNQLSLSSRHMDHFNQERAMKTEDVHIRQYRTLEANKSMRRTQVVQLVRDIGELDGVPGFAYMKADEEAFWDVLGGAGFLIPFRSLTNMIQGYQIRFDAPLPVISAKGNITVRQTSFNDITIIDRETGEMAWEGTRNQLPVKLPQGEVTLKPGAKYKWLASGVFKERGVLKGTSVGNPSPYHAAVPTSILSKWKPGQPIQECLDTSTIWWGEGPLKGDIASNITNRLHLQTAGVNTWRVLLEPTLALKPKTVILGFDADSQTKEDSVGEAVIRCVEALRPIFKEQGIILKIAVWPESIAKGLDDLFIQGYQPQIVTL